VRRGRGFAFVDATGRTIRDPDEVRRLRSLAVPPAYRDVLYSDDPCAHLQAIGRDAAGRLQYRYHPAWETVREIRKARRLARLVDVLPKIRRGLSQHLGKADLSREFVLAAVIELVVRSAIRSGSERYARMNGTRGAATLHKSNVAVDGRAVTLAFRSKGGKSVRKTFHARRLAAAIEVLRALPGSRLFKYRDQTGAVRPVSAADVNAFLRELAGVNITVKDFRTLTGSIAALETLAKAVPAMSGRGRRRQVLEAVRGAAEKLANTPAVCRRSYVHRTVVAAFENGALGRMSTILCRSRSVPRHERLLAQVIAVASERTWLAAA
jgi:DNA topoisomerase-1